MRFFASKGKKSVPPKPTKEVIIGRLAPIQTGHQDIDWQANEYWKWKEYDKLKVYFLEQFNKAEDEEGISEYFLRNLKVNWNRSYVAWYVVEQILEFDWDPNDFVVYFESMDPDLPGCPFTHAVDEPKYISLPDYLENPSCCECCDKCTSDYRRYFCGILIRRRP